MVAMAELMSEYVEQQRALYALHPDIMGTRFEIIMYDADRASAEALWQRIVERLEAWHAMFNRFDRESELSRLNDCNDTQWHAVSEELADVLTLCREYWLKTEHLFDITRRDMSLVELKEGQVRKLSADITLDLGGFAKGYALLRVREMLTAEGISRAIADFGHSTIMTIGRNGDEDWVIGLPSPYDGCEVVRFALNDQTLSTSGNTPSYAGHIVNPQSGERNNDRALSCIVAASPLDAEVLSTVQMIASEEQMASVVANFDIVTAKRYEL